MPLLPVPEVRTRVVHGYRRAYVVAGSGPALLLLHGVGCDHRTWLPVLPRLAEHFTVIAPDLLGHGRSAKPRADYSLGGYANGMRDLLGILGIERVTVVGHSFGGGVAMQFGYQYPERTDRIILVSSGGLGPDVSPLLRALSMPGAGLALAAAASPPAHLAARVVLGSAARLRLPYTADVPGVLYVLASVNESGARSAFLHVLRSTVDWRGQVVSMLDRAYLAAGMPMLVVWGDRDTVVPVRHAENARRALPRARVEVLPGVGHFPHEEQPEVFTDLLLDFVRNTEPSRWDKRTWRALLRGGRPAVDGAPEPGDPAVTSLRRPPQRLSPSRPRAGSGRARPGPSPSSPRRASPAG